MKPRNFPARKLRRQHRAISGPHTEPSPLQHQQARAIRTKKRRSGKGRAP